MNDTPDRSTSPLVTRRTLAKTAAWAAPAIALAAASPAHAASPSTPPGFITFDKQSYDFEPGVGQIIRGTIVPPMGQTLPDNFRLSNDFAVGGAGGFATLVSPIVTGDNRFELLIKGAGSAGATDTLKVYSTNHPAYVPGETALVVGGTPEPDGRPSIVFDEDVFSAQGAMDGPITITGRIEMPGGKDAPADLVLMSQAGVEGWTVSQPVITGNTFVMTITYTKKPVAPRIGDVLVMSANDPAGYDIATAYVVNLMKPS